MQVLATATNDSSAEEAIADNYSVASIADNYSVASTNNHSVSKEAIADNNIVADNYSVAEAEVADDDIVAEAKTEVVDAKPNSVVTNSEAIAGCSYDAERHSHRGCEDRGWVGHWRCANRGRGWLCCWVGVSDWGCDGWNSNRVWCRKGDRECDWVRYWVGCKACVVAEAIASEPDVVVTEPDVVSETEVTDDDIVADVANGDDATSTDCDDDTGLDFSGRSEDQCCYQGHRGEKFIHSSSPCEFVTSCVCMLLPLIIDPQAKQIRTDIPAGSMRDWNLAAAYVLVESHGASSQMVPRGSKHLCW